MPNRGTLLIVDDDPVTVKLLVGLLDVDFKIETATNGAEALEPLLAEPELWQSAAAWREHIAGAPRIAEDVYSWTRPDTGADPSLVPPGLRNGSGSTAA